MVCMALEARGSPTHEEGRGRVEEGGQTRRALAHSARSVCSLLCQRQTVRLYWIKARTNKRTSYVPTHSIS